MFVRPLQRPLFTAALLATLTFGGSGLTQDERSAASSAVTGAGAGSTAPRQGVLTGTPAARPVADPSSAADSGVGFNPGAVDRILILGGLLALLSAGERFTDRAPAAVIKRRHTTSHP